MLYFMNKLFLLIVFSFFFNISQAQKEANNWYFGNYLGLSFTSGSPVLLTDGQIVTDEGVATISDKNGNLLFYTDGIKVWNKLHIVMPNGFGLYGDQSSSQSAIIVPYVDDTTKFFVFTVDAYGNPKGLNYSIVNMALNNGLGDVEIKNVPLITPICEKITAVKHCNGKDIWVIVHKRLSDAFYAYLVTATGVSNTPVISNSGRVIPLQLQLTFGCMKASPDGKKLALAHNLLGLDLFDFDNSTGVVSNPFDLFLVSENYTQPYGVEFSPDSHYLYVSLFYLDLIDFDRFDLIAQYDAKLNSQTAVTASKKIISKEQDLTQTYGSLQTGPDGKIYMAQFVQQALSVINSPNLAGTACNFSLNSIVLPNTTTCRLGLPSFIQSYWNPSFTFSGNCNGLSMQFFYTKPNNINTVKWDFGDPLSGPNNFSIIDSPLHIFSQPGLYTVQQIRFSNCANDTVRKIVQVGAVQVNLGADTTICGTNQFVLNPNTVGAATYLWQDGTTSPTFSANQSGLYWVEVKNSVSGCIKRDSIQLTFSPNPQFDLGQDFSTCIGEVTSLSVNINATSYLWNTGALSNSISITQSGLYWLEVNLNGCKKRDSIQVVFNSLPIVNLGKDTTLCDDNTLLLNATNTYATYYWQDASTSPTYTVTNAGTYAVKVTLNGCITKDTTVVQYQLKPKFTLGADKLICPGLTITLDPKLTTTGLQYLWQDGTTLTTYNATQQGLYYVDISNYCGDTRDSITITKGLCKVYVPTAFTPNGDGINDVFKVGGGEAFTYFSLNVFNRWGAKIFTTKNISEGWNGTIQNKPQPTGAYIYQVEYKDATTNEIFRMKGTVVLIR
jgi:gliding motility-associated-like protein